MAKRRYLTRDAALPVLAQARRLAAQGATPPEICRRLGISHQTYDRIQSRYGELPPVLFSRQHAIQEESSVLLRRLRENRTELRILRTLATEPDDLREAFG